MKLAVIRIGTGSPPQIVAHPIRGTVPAWSPDGAWIAYQTDADLRVVSPDGTRVRVLLRTDMRFENALVWSRDGRTLYSVRRTDDRVVQLFAIDVATSVLRPVSMLGADFDFAAPNDGLRFTLAPDGRSFLATIVRSRTGLWILDGLAPRQGILDWFRRRRSQ